MIGLVGNFLVGRHFFTVPTVPTAGTSSRGPPSIDPRTRNRKRPPPSWRKSWPRGLKCVCQEMWTHSTRNVWACEKSSYRNCRDTGNLPPCGRMRRTAAKLEKRIDKIRFGLTTIFVMLIPFNYHSLHLSKSKLNQKQKKKNKKEHQKKKKPKKKKKKNFFFKKIFF